MPRGRKKDLTTPPTRALAIQRAYRDRKAKHVADLEERCLKAETENEQLRQELAATRAQLQAASTSSAAAHFGQGMIRACSELMHNLVRTTGSISRLEEQLSLSAGMASRGQNSSTVSLTSASKPDDANASSQATTSTEAELAALLSYFSTHASSAVTHPGPTPSSSTLQDTPTPMEHSPPEPMDPHSWGSLDPSDPDCCSGILDCRGLVEEEGGTADARATSSTMEYASEDVEGRAWQRVSGHRSTLAVSSPNLNGNG
ncbi:hypothetical protein EVG20_g6981 [Dentipellis fragilis]|uniref:BZIP domain-containing protein n=1 Tax=Dentipellis fragilis TaxID=205917 RepID=A0A4Y9YJ49_9AGAM|nr:hypothetical protein EVG20_g6981 [Dentipellis fragilis]